MRDRDKERPTNKPITDRDAVKQFMKASQSVKPLSFRHWGSVTSFMYSAVMRSFEASSPAGLSTVASELDTLFR